LLVAQPWEVHFCRLKHAWFHHYLDSGVFMLHRATIKPNYLSVIMNDFISAAEELPQCHFGSYVHITDSFWLWLIHSAESSSKNAAFNFDAFVVTDVEKGVLF